MTNRPLAMYPLSIIVNNRPTFPDLAEDLATAFAVVRLMQREDPFTAPTIAAVTMPEAIWACPSFHLETT